MRPISRWLLVAAVILPLFVIAPQSSADADTPSLDWYVGKILFKSDRSGTEAIYAVNPDGTDLQIVDDPNVGYYYAEALKRDLMTTDGRYRLYVREVGSDAQIWQEDTETGAIAYVIGGTEGTDYEPAWAPDSRYVAYVSQSTGNDEIHIYDRQTGDDRQLTNNSWEWDKHPSFSADSSQIVFWSNREAQWKHIWLMNRDGSEQHNISGWEKANDYDPVWVKQTPSPVESSFSVEAIAFESTESCSPALSEYVGNIVFKSDRDGTTAFFLLDPNTASVCKISDPYIGYYYAEAQERQKQTADGRYELFVKKVSGNYQIWQEDTVTGDTAFVIGGGREADYDPVWGPDSRYVAYVSEREGGDDIYLFDRVTEQVTRLTENTWEWDKKPTWSPDGTQIAFWSNRETQWKHIWVMDADGKNQRNLSGYGKYNDWDPIWFWYEPTPVTIDLSPLVVPTATPKPEAVAHPVEWYVGKILFTSDRGGTEAIYAVNPDGTDLEMVTDPNIGYYYAEALQRDVTSSDGRYVLYVTQVGDDYQIWQQDTQTGATAYVVGGVDGADYDPAWAPDSRYVAYVSQVDASDEIHLYDRHTGEDTRLTENTWEWDKHPSFSADSTQIVFWSNREARWKHIWVMNRDGSEPRNISGWLEANDWDPVWVKQAPTPR